MLAAGDNHKVACEGGQSVGSDIIITILGIVPDYIVS